MMADKPCRKPLEVIAVARIIQFATDIGAASERLSAANGLR